MNEQCVRCSYDKFSIEPVFELYNKEAEYVEGYGHKPVWVQTGSRKTCKGCGFEVGKDPSKVLPNPTDL